MIRLSQQTSDLAQRPGRAPDQEEKMTHHHGHFDPLRLALGLWLLDGSSRYQAPTKPRRLSKREEEDQRAHWKRIRMLDARADMERGSSIADAAARNRVDPAELAASSKDMRVRLAYVSLRRWSLNPTSLEDVARHLGVSPEEMAQPA
jgi:hypothetical protein